MVRVPKPGEGRVLLPAVASYLLTIFQGLTRQIELSQDTVDRLKIRDVVSSVSKQLGELWAFDKTSCGSLNLQAVGTRAARIRESPRSVQSTSQADRPLIFFSMWKCYVPASDTNIGQWDPICSNSYSILPRVFEHLADKTLLLACGCDYTQHTQKLSQFYGMTKPLDACDPR